VSFAASPNQGLTLLQRIEQSGVLQNYAPFHVARADMLRRLGRSHEAGECYRRALPFAENEQVRRFIGRQLRGFGS
jgi:RNA polymerase sigma-70 factor (ECF subfamily)